MSLATRCPVCQTVFRVVQDQLKVSEGWVRCGRCAKVFNAFEGLFDLEREFPALRGPTPSQRVLEDLATRNRQPKQPSVWQDDFDTGSSSHAISQPGALPTAPATSRTATAATVPHVSVARVPAPAPTSTAAVTAPVPAASAAPTSPSIDAVPREPTPLMSRMPRAPVAERDDAATIPPASVPVAAKPAVRGDADRAPMVAAAPVTPAIAAAAPAVAPPPPPPAPPIAAVPSAAVSTAAPAPAPPAPQAVAKTAARANTEIAIRDEPAPVPGTEQVEAADPEQSFEALFRSDGEMAQSQNDADDVDIVLDSDVEPASLDDAVDSRLLTFVQQADRAERWQRPWVRTVMALCALALTMLLAAQLLVAQRDSVVAQWPGSRSLVQSVCAPLDCRIEPLRRIEQLGVDSSGLTRIDDGPIYRLVLVLRNRSEMPLLMPSIDLSLTDAAGVLVSRRMLNGSDLGTVRNTIAAGQELPLQALLMSAERPLTGYTIEIFYP